MVWWKFGMKNVAIWILMETTYTLWALYTFSRPLVKKHTKLQFIGDNERTNERTKNGKKQTEKVMKRKEKVCSLRTNYLHSTAYTQKKETYPCSCGICIIHFISINPFVCIIQGSPAIPIPCVTSFAYFTKFLHHLTLHTHARTQYVCKNRRREAEKASFKMFNFLFKQIWQQWESKSDAAWLSYIPFDIVRFQKMNKRSIQH